MTILVAPNEQRDIGLEYSQRVARILSNCGVKVLSTLPFASVVHVVSYEEGLKHCDIVIVLGGDGTILRVAQVTAEARKEILGINLGKIGYMAGLEPTQFAKLVQLCRREYFVEERMMLSVRVLRKGDSLFCAKALNDVVISHGAISRMIDLEVFRGEQPLSSYRADGVIFSTPTGSTAYSLSAGGPVIEPTFQAILMTPVCAHSLRARPTLFSGDSELRLKSKEGNTFVTVDGDRNFALLPGDEIQIVRAECVTRLIRFDNNSFCHVLNNKLN